MILKIVIRVHTYMEYWLFGRCLDLTNDQVTFLYQPVVELVSSVDATGLANAADLVILLGISWGAIQQQLNRAGEVFAELPALIINVTFHR